MCLFIGYGRDAEDWREWCSLRNDRCEEICAIRICARGCAKNR